ncbi:hypothetical protein [Peribacillus aracenensis]|uniref:hypothetical protein n=1 Tax=Peribacillus aracenensis TaxID=2976708 RepID=UPI0021A3298B|nr:hypothetical protein [Peribacillus sp. BBB004]
MADKIYQLPYDDEIDKDIAVWLKELPRARKAELVRNAIRFYLQASNGDGVITVNTSPGLSTNKQDNPKEEIKKQRPKGLPKDGSF